MKIVSLYVIDLTFNVLHFHWTQDWNLVHFNQIVDELSSGILPFLLCIFCIMSISSLLVVEVCEACVVRLSFEDWREINIILYSSSWKLLIQTVVISEDLTLPLVIQILKCNNISPRKEYPLPLAFMRVPTRTLSQNWLFMLENLKLSLKTWKGVKWWKWVFWGKIRYLMREIGKWLNIIGKIEKYMNSTWKMWTWNIW